MSAFLRQRITNLAQLFAVILAFVTLFSFAASFSHVADLMTPFRHLYVIGGIPVLLVLIASDRPRLSAFTATIVAINLALVQPALPRGQKCEPNFTVVTLNALSGSTDVARTLKLLNDVDADVVVVTELGSELSLALQQKWRYFIAKPNKHTSGMGIFSRHPMAQTNAERGAWFDQLTGVVSVHNKQVRVLGVHPPPPLMPTSAQLRNGELAQIAKRMQQFGAPAILAGDLNVTRQSPYFDQLLDIGLVDTRVGQGVGGTWPAKSIFRIGIDHVMHTGDIQTCSSEVGRSVGSDHRPFIAKMHL